jgi:hypothetical protein
LVVEPCDVLLRRFMGLELVPFDEQRAEAAAQLH